MIKQKRTAALDPGFDGDACEDDCCTNPLTWRKLVVVDDNGEEHREQLAGECDCPVFKWV